MFPSKDLPTMASREPARQAIIDKTAEFLAMGGEINVIGTIINSGKKKIYTSEVEKKSIEYNDRKRAARTSDKKAEDNLRFHRS